MRRIAPVVFCLAICCPVLAGCGALAPVNDTRMFASMLSLLEFDSEPPRDTEHREELALVAPQETIDPDDPDQRELEFQRRHYYRAFEPIYPGVDYANLPD